MDIKKSQYKTPEEIDDVIKKTAIKVKDYEGLVDHNYYSNGLEPIIEHYVPEGIELTPEELISLKNGMRRLSTGLRSSIPINCYGEKCPFLEQCPFHKINKLPVGKSCHLPGTLIYTAQHGEVKIEDLDSQTHSLISYNRRRNCMSGGYQQKRIGYNFKKVEREFEGNIVKIESESGLKQDITYDHISIAKFNDKALGRFCVYLMKRGDFFRVGKSQILNYNERADKYHMPVGGRLGNEDGDALWILATYESNAEALLAEEYFSIRLKAPKALFLEDKGTSKKRKNSGLYKWATQEDLDTHHSRFLRPPCYWSEELEKMGLSLDYPFLERDNSEKKYEDIKVYAKRSMFIRACNLIEGIMDIPSYTEDSYIKEGGKRFRPLKWERLSMLTVDFYKGKVFSLDVEKYKTYFANKIGTHNCPVESILMDTYTKRYLDEFSVEAQDMSEVATMTMLAATHIIEMRAFTILGKDDNDNPDGFIKNVVGFNNDDEPIIQLQEHPAYNQIERAWRWRRNLLESLVGTRKEKYKRQAAMKERTADSTSTAAADLKAKIDKMSIIDITER